LVVLKAIGKKPLHQEINIANSLRFIKLELEIPLQIYDNKTKQFEMMLSEKSYRG
jgi:hypothetical protein